MYVEERDCEYGDLLLHAEIRTLVRKKVNCTKQIIKRIFLNKIYIYTFIIDVFVYSCFFYLYKAILTFLTKHIYTFYYLETRISRIFLKN